MAHPLRPKLLLSWKIHEKRGDTDEARAYYQRFVDYWKDGDMDRERVEEALGKAS